MALLNNKVPGRMSFNFYICTGQDPTDYEDIKPKVSNPMFSIINTCSIISTGIKKGGSDTKGAVLAKVLQRQTKVRPSLFCAISGITIQLL